MITGRLTTQYPRDIAKAAQAVNAEPIWSQSECDAESSACQLKQGVGHGLDVPG